MSTTILRSLFKPRYTIAHLAKSKVWPYKNSRLRRFFALRGRRLQRGGLFRRYILVATTRKWTRNRRRIRPVRRRSGHGRSGGGRTTLGRPQKRRYRDSFYTKQQLRAFHGKRSEHALRSIVLQSGRGTLSGDRSRSFFASLESRLDRILFRRRRRPTIYACHQFVCHQGIAINGKLEYSPHALLRVGDTLSFVPLSSGNRDTTKNSLEQKRNQRWSTRFWDLFFRVFFRRWGLYILRRRLTTQLKKKLRPFAVSNSASNRRRNSSLAFVTQPRRKSLTKKRKRRKRKKRRSNRKSRKGFSVSFGERKNQTFAKFRQYLKLRLAVRLRTSLLPSFSSSRLSGRQKSSWKARNVFSGQKGRFYRRKKRRRYRLARRAKNGRRRKIVRLNPVHRFFPSYLQRDLRTLRATRIHSPSPEESRYAFRGSIAQVRTFYRSRGF